MWEIIWIAAPGHGSHTELWAHWRGEPSWRTRIFLCHPCQASRFWGRSCAECSGKAPVARGRLITALHVGRYIFFPSFRTIRCCRIGAHSRGISPCSSCLVSCVHPFAHLVHTLFSLIMLPVCVRCCWRLLVYWAVHLLLCLVCFGSPLHVFVPLFNFAPVGSCVGQPVSRDSGRARKRY